MHEAFKTAEPLKSLREFWSNHRTNEHLVIGEDITINLDSVEDDDQPVSPAEMPTLELKKGDEIEIISDISTPSIKIIVNGATYWVSQHESENIKITE